MRDRCRGREHVTAESRRRAFEKSRGGKAPTATITRSLDRGEEAAGTHGSMSACVVRDGRLLTRNERRISPNGRAAQKVDQTPLEK